MRNADGALYEQDAGALRAHPHEGEGVVVVTLVVAARRELTDVARATDASELGELLSELRALGDDLVALEVIWSPSADADRLSTAELTALYPDLARLDDRSVGGRVFCDHCRGPYAHELGACPHCGAPSPDEARS